MESLGQFYQTNVLIFFVILRKRYEKAEKEFIDAKMDLYTKGETKEHLTEHLYTIINKNETRKAKKLVELMEALAMEVSPEEMELAVPSIPPLTNFNAVTTLHHPGRKTSESENTSGENNESKGCDGEQQDKNSTHVIETQPNKTSNKYNTTELSGESIENLKNIAEPIQNPAQMSNIQELESSTTLQKSNIHPCKEYENETDIKQNNGNICNERNNINNNNIVSKNSQNYNDNVDANTAFNNIRNDQANTSQNVPAQDLKTNVVQSILNPAETTLSNPTLSSTSTTSIIPTTITTISESEKQQPEELLSSSSPLSKAPSSSSQQQQPNVNKEIQAKGWIFPFK